MSTVMTARVWDTTGAKPHDRSIAATGEVLGTPALAVTSLTNSKALVSDSNGNVVESATTATQIGFSSNLTSDVQAQINGKLSTNQTITLSGDVTGSGATAITATLANTAVTAGSYGSATQVPAITVDSKGRITAVTATTISPDAGHAIITSEAITAPALVYVYNNSGTATCRNANATNASYPAVGYIKTTAASGANATVFFAEADVTGFTGLTPGIQFLSTTNGAPTATAPSGTGNIVQEVGVAYSSTAMHFKSLGINGV